MRLASVSQFVKNNDLLIPRAGVRIRDAFLIISTNVSQIDKLKNDQTVLSLREMNSWIAVHVQ